MAKGLRSSVKKTNRSKLRTRVFGPVEAARTERLSAKLLELASQPRAEKTEMETEATDSKSDAQPEAQGIDQAEAMDVDAAAAAASKPSKGTSRSKKSARVHKKRRGKAANSVVFPRKGDRSVSGKKGKR